MRIEVIAPSELTPNHVAVWRDYQRGDFVLASPCFAPEYAQVVGQVRSKVRIAVLESDGGVVGFFPFERTRWNIGKPVGAQLSDFSGVIGHTELQWDAMELVRGCGLTSWDFKDVPAAHQPVQPYHKATYESAYLDLRGDLDPNQRIRQIAGPAAAREIARRSRKLHTDVGPLRFEFHTTAPDVFDALVRWKSEQRTRTRTFDILQLRWAMELLERIRGCEMPGFAGVMSALYAGEQLAAVHLGIRSQTVLHSWIPAFNRSLKEYAPGTLLLWEIARAGAEMGIERIDLGRGDEPYKGRFKSGAIALAAGAVDRTVWRRTLTTLWYQSREWTHRSPWAGAVHRVKYAARRASFAAARLMGEAR